MWQTWLIVLCILIVVIAVVVYAIYKLTTKGFPKPAYRRPQFVPEPDKWSDTGLYIAWIGHSTLLMRINGITVLTDPVFSHKVGVRIPFLTIGPARHVSPALEPEDLPPIDVVLLSHAHLDHLDMPSLRAVVSPATEIVTAHGTGRLPRKFDAKHVHELAPGETLTLSCGLEISGQRVRHWGNRFPWNRRYGFLGYILKHADWRVFFAGDTAYTQALSEVKAHHPDVTCMPIGAYAPETFQGAHCTPEEAWKMFEDTGAQVLVPMHHDTFVLSRELVDEPLARLIQAAGEKKNRIVITQHGQTFYAKSRQSLKRD
ncbi:MBL fold metallo-hydrolase [Alicyclobacillus fodiniaquatilis]|uniref:MBL fold metallo-hydrolase n=1 Tax=Alicyclobacillus fodiniaquatilis TaxID=1661150 RepID=A0ABW4JM98_9BACL